MELFTQKFKFCQDLLMIFQTPMTLFLPWKIKGEILNNILVILFHADKMNGIFKSQKECKSTLKIYL